MIADKIQELRIKQGYSQAALSKKLKVTRATVNAWESGLNMPSAQCLIELCLLFKTTADYLLGLDNKLTLSLDNLTDDEIKVLYNLVDIFTKNKNAERHEEL